MPWRVMERVERVYILLRPKTQGLPVLEADPIGSAMSLRDVHPAGTSGRFALQGIRELRARFTAVFFCVHSTIPKISDFFVHPQGGVHRSVAVARPCRLLVTWRCCGCVRLVISAHQAGQPGARSPGRDHAHVAPRAAPTSMRGTLPAQSGGLLTCEKTV